MAITLDLSKAFELDLTKAGVIEIPTMQVKVAIDKSGSMYYLYTSGWVDSLLNVFAAVGMTFDNDSSLDVAFFEEELFESAPITLKNTAQNYIKRHNIVAQGGTEFCPVLEWINQQEDKEQVSLWKRWLGKPTPKPVKQYPTYVVMLTDGENQDRGKFDKKLNNLKDDQFLQIIGIGRGVPVKYLEGLAEKHDKVAFTYISNPTQETEETLLATLTNDKLVAFINKLG